MVQLVVSRGDVVEHFFDLFALLALVTVRLDCTLGGSSFLQVFRYVLFDAFGDIACIFFHELLTGDVFVQFDVAFADGGYDFVCHFRNLLSFFALEAVVHQPFAYELL